MIIEGLIAEKLEETLSDVASSLLKQSISKWIDESSIKKAIAEALIRTEKRFIREYGTFDVELTEVLASQTYFIDLPSVQEAAQKIIRHPFRDFGSQRETSQQSFLEVLPSYTDRTRVDAALNAFLHCLGQEVLEIEKLQPLYQLLFRKVRELEIKKLPTDSLESSERTALREFLAKRFSVEELKTLAFDLSVDYESFSHETNEAFSREFIIYFERRGNLNRLLEEILKRRESKFITELLEQNISSEDSFPSAYLNAESSREVLYKTSLIADNTARLLESTNTLVKHIAQLPENLIPLTLPQVTLTGLEHSHPWHNLPQRPYTQFIGREPELAKMRQLLLPHPKSRHYFIGIDGVGGVGKSTLALELGYYYLNNYDILPTEERFEFIIWVSAKREILTSKKIQSRLPTFNNLSDIYREIANVLELPSILQAEPEQRRGLVERALARQRTLLIVDNLETIDDEDFFSFLLEVPEPTKVLGTTRQRVTGAYPLRLQDLPSVEAYRLIEAEVHDASVELKQTDQAKFFRATSGLPLAIVWSVGLLSMGYNLEAVIQRLGSGQTELARFCFEEVITSIRNTDAYRLLTAQTLFEASVNREMLGKIAGLEGSTMTRDDALAKLFQLSLFNKQAERFFMLPLARTYMLEELSKEPSLVEPLRERWITVLLNFAKPYSEVQWYWQELGQIQAEGIHIGTLVNWAIQFNRTEVLLKALPAQVYYYDLIGLWEDLSELSQIALEHAQSNGDKQGILATRLYAMNWFLLRKRRFEEAEQNLTEALEQAQQSNLIDWQCEVLLKLSELQRWRNDLVLALDYCQQALSMAAYLPQMQQFYARLNIENEMGRVTRDQLQWKKALSHFLAVRKMLSYKDKPAYDLELAWGVLGNLGFVAHQIGKLDEAAQIYQYCLNTFRKASNRSYMTATLMRLASLEKQRGNTAISLSYAKEALEWSRRLEMVKEEKLASELIASITG
jgi:LuxR family glucitol operon transcriptional activator